MSKNQTESSSTADNLGKDNTIPNTEDGIAVGHSSESSFEPEEDTDED
ncbi:hypothetical protein [Rhodococcus sp. H29-C3]|nr:hypothetical protein [Rhodococcus sp. H29-C3]MDJ0360515.1 hypothetical protein [Rhodococcus sp. H29-C3]